MIVISLGWGVQSFALAAMSALGELPPVDAAIHADTGHERSETYEFAAKWTPWLEERGVRVVTVRAPSERRPAVRLEHVTSVMIPAFTAYDDGLPTSGMLRRQCTHGGYVCYLHSARKPLSEIDFRNAEDHGQLSLWPNECTGICGV